MKASALFAPCLEEDGIEYISGVPDQLNTDFIHPAQKSCKITDIASSHIDRVPLLLLSRQRETPRMHKESHQSPHRNTGLWLLP